MLTSDRDGTMIVEKNKCTYICVSVYTYAHIRIHEKDAVNLDNYVHMYWPYLCTHTFRFLCIYNTHICTHMHIYAYRSHGWNHERQENAVVGLINQVAGVEEVRICVCIYI